MKTAGIRLNIPQEHLSTSVCSKPTQQHKEENQNPVEPNKREQRLGEHGKAEQNSVASSGVPNRGLGDLVVDGQVWLVVLGEGGPWNWDFAVAIVGISGQEERPFIPV